MKMRRDVRGERVYWQVDLGVVGGRRQRKTFNSRSKAATFLRAMRKERDAHGRAAFNLSYSILSPA